MTAPGTFRLHTINVMQTESTFDERGKDNDEKKGSGKEGKKDDKEKIARL